MREAHPEVCLCALDGGSPTGYSKTGQPAAAFWERVDILERVDSTVLTHLRRAGTDDVVDAFALALTARPDTGELRTLPEDPPVNPEGLPMEMVYRVPD